MITKTERISEKMLLPIVVLALLLFTAGAAAKEEENVSVRVNAPEFVSGTFDVTIDVHDVIDLNSGQFDLSFDPDVVNVNDVYGGAIDGTRVPIDMWILVDENRARVLFKLPETGLVSGSGYLATIACEVVGNVGDASDLEVSSGELFSYTSNDNPILGGNTEHKEITADWSGDVVTVGTADMVGAAATASMPVRTATPRSSPTLDLGVGLVTASTPATEHISDVAVPAETSEADEPDWWDMLVKHNFIETYLFIGLLAFAYTLILLR